MPEIANCPLCKNPQVEMLNEHSTPGGAYCCGVRCDSLELWNRYAAAMELAIATVANEGVSSFDEDYETNIAFVDAKDRVLEVFK